MNCHNLCFPPESATCYLGEPMCGRYASARKRTELLEEFGVERDRVSEPLEPDYNVEPPTKSVYAVLTSRPRGTGEQQGGDGAQADAKQADAARADAAQADAARSAPPGRRAQPRGTGRGRGEGTARRSLGTGSVLGQGP